MMTPECWICQGPHHEELHQSTRRIRAWLIRKIDLASTPVPVGQRRVQPFPGMGDVQALRCPASRKKAAAK